MEHLPSWFWIAVLDVGFFACGVTALWWMARRTLGREEQSLSRRSWLRALEHRLVDRVDEFVSNPPTWKQIAAVLGPVAAVIAVGLAGWTLWAHTGEWFAAAAPPPHRPPPDLDLPFDSLFDSVAHSVFPLMCKFLGIVSLATAILWFAIGESTKAATSVLSAAVLFASLSAFGSIYDALLFPPPPAAPGTATSTQVPGDEPGEPAASELAEEPVHAPREPAVAAAADAPVESGAPSQDLAPPAQTNLDGAEPTKSSLSAVREESPSSPPSAASEHSSSGFGVGDALMVYGAYKLLTGSESHRTVVSAPTAAPHVESPAPTTAPSRSVSQQPERARSTPPTYRAPASSTPSFGLRSRLLSRPTFRRGR